MRKVYQKTIDIVRQRWGEKGLKVAIVHTAAPAAADELQGMAKAQLNCAELFVTEMSPSLGVHIGLNSLSLCYVPAEVQGEPE